MNAAPNNRPVGDVRRFPRLLRRWIEIWWHADDRVFYVTLVHAEHGPGPFSRPLRLKEDAQQVARRWSEEIGLPIFTAWDRAPLERGPGRAA